jgi:MFS transporter, YNFM family, putative membrane transport protein
MSIDRRRIAVALAGFSAFVNLYAPQALLPSLAHEFGTSAADTSMTITAGTLAVALIAPFAGTVADVLGRKRVIVTAMFALMTLASSLRAIVLGFAITAGCGFLCQAVSTGFVAMTAQEGHSSAVGLYVTWYYIGGSAGAALPGLARNAFRWPGCVATVVVTLILMGLVVWHFWTSPVAQER